MQDFEFFLMYAHVKSFTGMSLMSGQLDDDEFVYYTFSKEQEVPPISVVVSTYNRFRQEGSSEVLVKRAVESILNQTFMKFELVLIDDYSTDSTKDFCLEIAKKDPRVRFFHFKKNSGLPAKRYNFGISQSRGKYIAFMFDDDVWEPNALEDLYVAIEKSRPSCGMVYGLAQMFWGKECKKVEVLGGKWKWANISSFNFIANNSVLIKRKAIDFVGGYDEDPIFARNCDWDLWWRIGRKFQVIRIPCKVAIVYGGLPESIGLTKVLDMDHCRKRQQSKRILPLQIKQEEPLRCVFHALAFDFWCCLNRICRHLTFNSVEAKQLLKKYLPARAYRILKISNRLLKKMRGGAS